MKPATPAQIETAIEVLRAYDGEMEPENQRDVDAVILWLTNELARREKNAVVRKVAREAGVSLPRARAALKRVAQIS